MRKAFIAACLLACIAGCAGGMIVIPNPLSVPNGAYSGEVVIQTTINSDAPTERRAYLVIDIVNGAIRNIRSAATRNGPYSCWRIQNNSQQAGNTITGILGGGVFTYSISSTTNINGTDVNLTGSGQATATETGAEQLNWSDVSTVMGGGNTVAITVTGTFTRHGAQGTLPVPEGMNGGWVLNYGGNIGDVIDVQGLRVIQFASPNPIGVGEVKSSDEVSPTGDLQAGQQVLIRFVANTFFTADPTPRDYTITFTGTVDISRQSATGTTTFEAVGVQTRMFNTTLQRSSSPACPL